MARASRKISPTGYYHVIQRGVGKQIIFEDNTDYECYLNKLNDAKEKSGVRIVAYCLMNNHAHLLVYANNLNMLSSMMSSIGSSYASHYNIKYDHSGHVFQNRYYSATIDDEKYLLTCVNYIHNNPSTAGISSHEEYAWSSYKEYISGKGITNHQFVIDILGGIDEFKKFSNQASTIDIKMDDCESEEIKMKHAQNIVNKELGYDFNSGLVVKKLSKEERDKVLHRLREEGYTLKQIELFTGVSKRIIQRAWSEHINK